MAEQRPHRYRSVVPELRRLHSPDLLDMQSASPENPEDFCLLVQAMIGPVDDVGEESFDFMVCTPKWLAHSLMEKKFIFGRHYLLVARYDYGVILETIKSLCQSIDGSTWKEVGERLSRYGKWEFEDYTEDSATE